VCGTPLLLELASPGMGVEAKITVSLAGLRGCTHSRVSLDWLRGLYRLSSIEPCFDCKMLNDVVKSA
jgi:hypothetical protein